MDRNQRMDVHAEQIPLCRQIGRSLVLWVEEIRKFFARRGTR